MGEVAIIGGSGFMGRHVVREILLREDLREEFRAVRVIDVVPFPHSFLEGLDEEGKVPIKTWLCDVAPTEVEEDVEEDDVQEEDVEEKEEKGRDRLLTKGKGQQRLQEALEGVRAVVHCAALQPTLFRGPEDLTEGERERMYQVNVQGTKNVIDASLAVGVQVLVYTSTVAAILGHKPILEHTESLIPCVTDEELLLGHYAVGRRRAEEEVLRAHGTCGKNDVALQTVALRPVTLFGEGDITFVPPLVSMGRTVGGALPCVGPFDIFFQAAYVGNAAAAHVLALSSLLKVSTASPLSPLPLNYCGGLPVFITDDTPLNTLQGLVTPFLEPLGVPVSTWRIPYLVAMFFILVLRFLLRVTENCRLWVGDPFSRVRGALPPPSILRQAYSTAVYPRIRATLGIQYSPKYSWKESLRRSNAFYSLYCSNPTK